MVSTSTNSHLQNRNGHYHLRLRIPSDLSSLTSLTEIVKSLKTTNLKTAKIEALPYVQGISLTSSSTQVWIHYNGSSHRASCVPFEEETQGFA
jgi:hypothetical protein